MNTVNKSSEIVMIRGTSVPLDETFSMDTPSKKLGWISDFMSKREVPIVVEGVVVMRRPDF